MFQCLQIPAQGSATDDAPSWTRARIADDSPTNFGSPVTRRKINQSPASSDQGSSDPKYRTPPQTPFQPGFYKPPPTEEPQNNPFPLSPKVARSNRIMKEKSSESIASNASGSSTKKMRRKMREAQRMGHEHASDSEENFDQEL